MSTPDDPDDPVAWRVADGARTIAEGGEDSMKTPTLAMIRKRVTTIAVGSHTKAAKALCVMEWVSVLAGEKHSDHPACASPVIAKFLRSWNDAIPKGADRKRLLAPLIRDVIGTRTTKADEKTRAWMCVDWLLRVQAPAWMDLTPTLQPHAAALRGLPPVTETSWVIAQPVASAAWSAARNAAENAANAAWSAAWNAAENAANAAWSAAGNAAGSAANAAWSAAGNAAGSAAESAAWNAAWNAAWSAAESAAWSAAWNAAENAANAAWSAAGSAAGSAAWSAARNAAGRSLGPTVRTLQGSAQRLVRDMCDVGRKEAPRE